MNNVDIDAYTSSIIAEKNGRSISQMMAQDEEDKKQAEFLREQKAAKEATDLANSLNKKKVVVPVKTDADDVLEMMQKMNQEEVDEEAERANMEKEENRFHEQKEKEVQAAAKKAADAAAKEAAAAKKDAEEQQKRLEKAEKEEREADQPEAPKAEKRAPLAVSPYTKAISTAETESLDHSVLEQQKAKSAAAQKEKAEIEEAAEIAPAAVQKQKVEVSPPVSEPQQRERVLRFDDEDQLATTKAEVHASSEMEDDGAWGAAAAASESLDELADKAEFAEKLRNEKKFLATHTVPAPAKPATLAQKVNKKAVRFADVQKQVHKELTEEQQWI